MRQNGFAHPVQLSLSEALKILILSVALLFRFCGILVVSQILCVVAAVTRIVFSAQILLMDYTMKGIGCFSFTCCVTERGKVVIERGGS